MEQNKILEDVNKGVVTSTVTGNPVDVRSLLGGVTEQGGNIVKAEVGIWLVTSFNMTISGNLYTMVWTSEY